MKEPIKFKLYPLVNGDLLKYSKKESDMVTCVFSREPSGSSVWEGD